MTRSSPSLNRLNGLVGHIYDAALDDSLWAGMSGRIAGALDATSTVMKLHGADDRVQLLETTPNMVVADHLQAWAEHWHARDLWVQRSVSFGMSRIVTSDQLVTADERRNSGFYQEWLRQLDIHHMIGAVFNAEGGAVGVLGIHRPHDARGFDKGDRQTAAVLLPHLERALRIGQRMAQAGFAADTALKSLDAVDTGVMIADARGRVRHINAVAEAMLAQSSELVLRSGLLSAHMPRAQEKLSAALRDAVALAAGQGCPLPAPLRIERPARAAWTLAAAPLRPRWRALTWQEPLALLLLRDPEFPPYRIEHLRALYGMTRMEALTAAELVRGRTLEEISTALGIGLGTVRTHLKQILIKTETNRQAQAVAVIARSVAAMPPA